MTALPVRWSDEVDEIMQGDLVVAAAYVTPAGGAVVTGVVTCGAGDREQGTTGFTTSLGLSRKLEHLIRDPHVSLAYHAREHGRSTSPRFVLAQGAASIDLQPSRERVEAFLPCAERYLGPARRGWLWDRVLREYYWERVFVDIDVRRVISWKDLAAAGTPDVSGAALPAPPDPQRPPSGGTGPRVDVAKAASASAKMRHLLLAYRSSDGFPAVVPVELEGHDASGLRLTAAPGLLPAGGRRAGILAHSFHPQVAGLATRTFTGWLDVADDGSAVYAPHTSKGYAAPPMKTMVLLFNGLYAKWGFRQAMRHGALERLRQLDLERAAPAGATVA